MRKLSEQLNNQQAQLDEQKAIIERLEAQLAHPPPPPPPPPDQPAIGLAEPAADGAEGRETDDDPRKKILVYGYIQGQFQVDQSSENVIGQDGKPLNQNRFLVPRARLVAEREWKLASVLARARRKQCERPCVRAAARGGDDPLSRPEPGHASAAALRDAGAVPRPVRRRKPRSRRVFVGSWSARSSRGRSSPPRSTSGCGSPAGLDGSAIQLAATNGQPLGTLALSAARPRLGQGRRRSPRRDHEADELARSRRRLLVDRRAWIPPGVRRRQAAIAVDRSQRRRHLSGGRGDGRRRRRRTPGVDLSPLRGRLRRRGPLGVADRHDGARRSAVLRDQHGSRALRLRIPSCSAAIHATSDTCSRRFKRSGDWFVVGFRTDYYNPDSDSRRLPKREARSAERSQHSDLFAARSGFATNAARA